VKEEGQAKEGRGKACRRWTSEEKESLLAFLSLFLEGTEKKAAA